ncbi:MAG TPA: GtrA family protein [Pseudobacteroides sp.]|uniref:GtrA family protein n=1 Tax=Pseudobacteroides sp. TaxID=1968840 RepID=UPI002F95F248
MASNTLFDGIFKSKFVTQFLNKNTMIQFGKTFAIGIAAAGCDFLIYHLLIKYFKLWSVFSSGASQIVGFWASFLLNKFWTFKIKENFLRQLSSYTVLFMFNLAFSSLAIYLLVDVMNMDEYFSKIFIMGLIFIWNFVLYKIIIYKAKGSSK